MAADPAGLPVGAGSPPGSIFVDVGSAATFVDSAGTSWDADAGFNGGKVVRGKPFAVEGTDDPALFVTRRQGNFAYAVPVAEGYYTVSLLFVDTVKKAGTRVFDIDAENERFETGVDVVARAGRRAALVVAHDVDVSGGALDLAFTGVKGKPVLSGIAIVPSSNPRPTPQPGPAPEPPLAPPDKPQPPNPKPAPPAPVLPPGVEPGGSIAWAAGPDAPVPRVEAGGIQVGNSLYIWGGFKGGGYAVHDRLDVFDMASQTWSTRRPSPAPATHAAVATDGRFIYAAGGQYGGGIPGTPSADVWTYDTLTDTWSSSLPDLPEARYGGGLSFLDNQLYFFGGNRPDRTTVAHDLWVLDLANVDFGWRSFAPLPAGLAGDHAGAAVLDGKIYAVGGEHGHAAQKNDGAPYIQHSMVMMYDPLNDVWTRKADLPQASSHAEAGTMVINGKIAVFGGQIDDIKVTPAVRAYDPVTDRWSLLTSLPEKRKGGVAGYLNGQVFYTGGQRDGDFRVSTDTWFGPLTGL